MGILKYNVFAALTVAMLRQVAGDIRVGATLDAHLTKHPVGREE